jgi:hyperosmotically inducible periplasmic protein
MKQTLAHTITAIVLTLFAAGCAQTAQGVVTDTKENASAVRGAVETLDVKSAIIADKTIDAGAIDVDTYQDKKVVVLRGSVPTDAQKAKAEQIARQHAEGYSIENRLAVVADK